MAVMAAATALGGGLAMELARADEKRRRGRKEEQDDAWEARRDGSILPLSEVLALVRPRIGDEIIETEFDYEDGHPVYEFKYVDPGGRVRELYVDARTGATLKDKPD